MTNVETKIKSCLPELLEACNFADDMTVERTTVEKIKNILFTDVEPSHKVYIEYRNAIVKVIGAYNKSAFIYQAHKPSANCPQCYYWRMILSILTAVVDEEIYTRGWAV